MKLQVWVVILLIGLVSCTKKGKKVEESVSSPENEDIKQQFLIQLIEKIEPNECPNNQLKDDLLILVDRIERIIEGVFDSDYKQEMQRLIDRLNLYKVQCEPMIETLTESNTLIKSSLDLFNKKDKKTLNNVMDTFLVAFKRLITNNNYIEKILPKLNDFLEKESLDQIKNSLKELKLISFGQFLISPITKAIPIVSKLIKDKNMSNFKSRSKQMQTKCVLENQSKIQFQYKNQFNLNL